MTLSIHSSSSTHRAFLLDRLTDEQITEILTNAIVRVTPPNTDVPIETDVSLSSQAEPSSSQTAFSSSQDGHSSSQPLPSSSQATYSEPDAQPKAPFLNYPQLTGQILSTITSLATGDARTALSLLEIVLLSPPTISEETLLSTLRKSVSTSYDRTGDSHYDMISALHKSVRGSQPDAAMYWLARMLEAGEDPLYIARRMTVCASEDVGLADSHALPLVRLSSALLNIR